MRPFTSTLPIADALAILNDVATPIDRMERVPLADAHDRVLAADIVATRDVPAFDRSAMDGYAVIAADTTRASAATPARLQLLDRLYAGDNAHIAVTAGTCVEIATGAPLPAGADAVVMVEDTRTSSANAADTNTHANTNAGANTSASATAIDILTPVREGQHLVRRASDMRQGDNVIAACAVLNASRLGALAALGLAEVDVYAKPIVAILPTGNELVDPGRPLPPGHVYEVNRFTLAALAQRHGGLVRIYPPALDTLDELRRALDTALAPRDSATTHAGSSSSSGSGSDVDLLVLSGGSSVGERDLVLDVLRERGDVLFHGLSVKPGKPTGLARIGHTLVLAMPGNPTSCLSNAHILLIPLLRRLARLPAHRPQTRQLPLAARVSSPAGKHQFMPVRVDEGLAYPTFKGSGEITSLSRADGYIEIPDAVEVVDEGTMVTVVMY
jgi:molybdenum cofactor synthesis domain-containing protein